MHRLTGGRFTLGLGPGHRRRCSTRTASRGSPPPSSRTSSALLRRLFRGEVVLGHDGPAGKFPVLHLDSSFDEDIPLGFVAFGPNSLALAGRADGHGRAPHLLHRRDRRALRARPCGRPPRRPGAIPPSVRIWSCYATVARRPPRGPAAQEDRRAAGHVPPGLRRPAGEHQRLGPGGAGALPGRPGGGRRSRAPSTTKADTADPRARRRRCSPTSGSSRRPPARPSAAPSACCASSTSASTA